MNKKISLLFFIASLVSVLVSIYLYTNVNLWHGIFVGLWAPTLMGLSNKYGIADVDAMAKKQ
jgi:hypothetical protein